MELSPKLPCGHVDVLKLFGEATELTQGEKNCDHKCCGALCPFS